MKVLVTGVAGYIGSIVADHLLALGYKVVGIDDLRTGFAEPMEYLSRKYGANFDFYKTTIKDGIESVIKKNRDIDAVVHLAASSNVNESVNKPEVYRVNNVETSKLLLEIMSKYELDKLIFASSAAVYGEVSSDPVEEDRVPIPSNPYGANKLEIEQAILSQTNIRGAILRFFNVCGAGKDGYLGDSRKPSTALVQNMVRGAMGLGGFEMTCPIVSTPDETTIRDYVDVEDIAEACQVALNYLEQGGERDVFNIGSGVGKSVLDVARIVEHALGVKIDIEHGMVRKGEVAQVVSNIEKARLKLGWKPKKTLENSVEALIKWYKSKPQGWSK